MGEHEKLMEVLQSKEALLKQKGQDLQKSMQEAMQHKKQYEHALHQWEHQKDQMLQKAKDEANDIVE